MPLSLKKLPPPKSKLLFHPEIDVDYEHFKDAGSAPFDASPAKFSRETAWWLADASLLAYWNPAAAKPKFSTAGLESAFVESDGTQAYVAWTRGPNDNGRFAFVAFRGTQIDEILDFLSDLNFPLTDWDEPGELVHAGFKRALDSVWQSVVDLLRDNASNLPVWFAGHSLGGALATLAGDRYKRTPAALGGIYTFGSPLVGDRAFVDGFNKRNGGCSFRFVNDQDSVTGVPPRLLSYRHVNDERFIGSDDPNVVWLREPVIDHTPSRYSILVWNSLVAERERIPPGPVDP